jgi:hypothetical protein
MKTTVFLLSAACLVVGVAAQTPQATVVNFDQDKPATPPAGFTFAAMRQPAPGAWLVRRSGTNGFLVHDPDASSQGYALAVLDSSPTGDISVSVRLRMAGGRRAGGIIWHYLDNQHYYASVLDLSRGEISLYRVASGNRVRVEFEDDLELDPEAWHTMKVSHTSRSTRVSLGGIRVFEDSRRDKDGTGGGRVGLVAAGDADVWYDDLRLDVPRN